MNQIWEYKILHLNSIADHHMLELNLNILGQQGWDLIFMQDQRLTLKRKCLPININYSDPQPIEIREDV